MFWIKSFYRKYGKLLPTLGSGASVLALLLMFRPERESVNNIYWLLIILIVFFIGLTLYLEIFKQAKIHVIPEEDKQKINEYMYKWINNSGRVAIFSRDMSFASSDKMIKDLLIHKSERGEVVLCVQKETALTSELKEKNAAIYYYSKSKDLSPRTRFTIANYGHGTRERVAVAHGENNFHVIQEFGKDDLVIYLTKDLIDLAIKSAEKHAQG